MSVGRESGDFDELLARTRQLLDEVRAGRGRPDGDAPAEVSGRGTACDGLVTATVVRGGRLDRVELDPRAMRLPSRDLAQEITVAVNAALDDLAAQVAAAGPADVTTAPDLARLAEQVRQMQDDGLRQMARFTGTLDAVAARLGRQ